MAASTELVGGTIDLPDFIDAQPVGRPQITLLLLCAAVLFVDGFDTQAIGYVAPEIARVWNLPRGALGPVFSASLFGLMLGALIFGPLADRVGRKRIILVSTAAFGIGTLCTALATGTTELFIMRFLTGLGLGGAMPNAVALTAEFSPHRRRGTLVMWMFCGFSVGAAVGGLIAGVMIPAFGWQSVFVLGGVAPLLLTPVLLLRLPESARFLALSGRAETRLLGIMRAMFPATAFDTGLRFTSHEVTRAGNTVSQLFTEDRAAATMLIWVVFFMSLLDLYFLSNWLPTVLNELGASVSLSAVIGSMLQVGGVAGAFGLGRFVDRFSFRALAVVYLLASIAITAIGMSGHSIVLTGVMIFLAGFCVVGGQNGCNALAATYYPTALRSTGVGWAFGIGRIGSIVGPLVGGMLLAKHFEVQSLFLAAAVPALCAAAAAFRLGTVANRKPDVAITLQTRRA